MIISQQTFYLHLIKSNKTSLFISYFWERRTDPLHTLLYTIIATDRSSALSLVQLIQHFPTETSLLILLFGYSSARTSSFPDLIKIQGQ
jgi:hypothetical protein